MAIKTALQCNLRYSENGYSCVGKGCLGCSYCRLGKHVATCVRILHGEGSIEPLDTLEEEYGLVVLGQVH